MRQTSSPCDGSAAREIPYATVVSHRKSAVRDGGQFKLGFQCAQIARQLVMEFPVMTSSAAPFSGCAFIAANLDWGEVIPTAESRGGVD
jgi:hypothetical protein